MVRKLFLFLFSFFDIVLIFISSIWFRNTGSVPSVLFLLIGIILFLKLVHYFVTDEISIPTFKRILFVLILGGLTGAIVFDLPVVYIFKAWSYPFDSFWKYLIVSIPGWAAFFVVFYDSFKILHLGLDKEFRSFGLIKIKNHALDNFFSYIGLLGLTAFIIAIALVGAGAQRVFMASLGALGVWFILENIEWQKTKRTFLSDLIQGHFQPLLAIILGSIIFGALFETLNHLAPRQNWVYYDLPWPHFSIFGVPIFLIVSWAWMYIIFLSVYRIVSSDKELWR